MLCHIQVGQPACRQLAIETDVYSVQIGRACATCHVPEHGVGKRDSIGRKENSGNASGRHPTPLSLTLGISKVGRINRSAIDMNDGCPKAAIH